MAAEDARLVVTDVDGVLTDGVIGLNQNGEEFKHFSVLDGLGVRLLKSAGVGVAFLSSRRSAAVAARAKDLGVPLYLSGDEDKAERLAEILRSTRLESGGSVEPAEVCYIGDDLVDLPCLRMVGFPVAVANARDEVRRQAAYTTSVPGGQGAFREVAELILKTRGLWESLMEKYR